MITPIFWITQDGEKLTIRIRAPHANLKELDYDHSQQMFIFSCQPYFLRLNFKQMVDEYGSGRGQQIQYDTDKCEFLIYVQKMHKNEHFEDLDMISELLRAPETPKHARDLVEEIGEYLEEEDQGDGEEYLEKQDNIRDLTEEIEKSQEKGNGYGFGWTKYGIIERLRDEIGRVVDLEYPEDLGIGERARECGQLDEEAFDAGRYLVDTIQPEDVLNQIITSDFRGKLEITDEDREKLKEIRKIIDFSKLDNISIANSLIDIIYAYLYDARVNEWDDEPSCESGWTCSKLSPSLAYFVKWNNVEEAVKGVIRRALTYPLYRSWQLSQKVVDDLKIVFRSGKSAILHVLCEIHRCFIASGEFKYLLNDLFITDYIVWIQSEKINKVLEDLKEELESLEVKKFEDLELLEIEAKLQMTQVLDSDDDEDS
ncbi:unnamed protein product [Caenorhabditis angaria]|uniref:Protein SHQ1 homolog n=1 Tax=Caenorhabditis angaria TaxID=860376 RepID=A0A9P1N2K3_9PELO|nr:unnamed protein product [Caenorhabditis angaria]